MRYSRRNCRAIRERCCCFSRVTASSGEPNSLCADRSRFHFDKRNGRAVISDQINFAFHAAIGEVSRDHHVSVPPKIPVRVRLAANAGSARPVLGSFRVGGADESDRPFRAAQFTRPNIARAKIGMRKSLFLCELCALCVKAFAEFTKGFNTEITEDTEKR